LDGARDRGERASGLGDFFDPVNDADQLAMVEKRAVARFPYLRQLLVRSGGVADVVALYPHVVGVAAAHRGLQGRRKVRRADGLRIIGIVRKSVMLSNIA
jgi:hypothetical protein